MIPKCSNPRIIAIVVAVVMGLVCALWRAHAVDRRLRSELLARARVAARAVAPERVAKLTGSEADLGTPDYLRLKEQLARMCDAQPGCRFLSLLGRRPQGEVFLFLDSEPPPSDAYSPPGQVYGEISTPNRRVFDEGTEAVTGPSTDRWGTWVTAWIPLGKSPAADGVAFFAMDVDAKQWRQAILLECAASLAVVFLCCGLVVALVALGQQARSPRKGENCLRTVIANLPVLLAAFDEKGHIIAWNKECEQVTGYSAAEIVGNEKALEALCPDAENRQWARDAVRKEPGDFRGLKSDLAAKDGEVRTVAWSSLSQSVPIPGWASWVIGVDITEHKRAEAQLRFQALLLSQIQDKVTATDLTGRITYVNEAECRSFGKSAEEIVGQHVETYGEDTARGASQREIVESTLSQGWWRGEVVNKIRDGQEMILDCRTQLVRNERDEPIGMVGISTDITEQKRVQESLRESRAILQAAMDHSQAGIVIADRHGKIRFINKAGLKIGGKGKQELVVSLDECASAWESYHFDGRRLANDEVPLARAFLRGEVNSLEFLLRRPAGDIAVWANAGPIWDAEHNICGSVAILVDITNRRRAETDRERLMLAVEQAHEIIVITDTQGTIQYVNPAFERTTGYSRDEAIGQNLRMLKSGAQDEPYYRQLWDTIQGGQTWEGRLENRKKDGTHYTEEATISPVRDSSGSITNYVAVKRDITQVMALESQYRQAQKMEAIGQLAGGVAHDFNNLLQVINGYTEIAREDLATDSPATAALEEIANAGQRAALLVGQLLAFSRRQVLRPVTLCLNDVVESAARMLQRVIGEHIRLAIIPGQRLDKIRADRGTMEQVLMNLCVNSRDAMPEGGVLTIGTDNVAFTAEYCRTRPWARPGRFVVLSVADTGCGMSQETLERVYEPFFTTKVTGKGTGLGLATVYGIVNQHHGMIQARSKPGKGTTFRIYLPVNEQESPLVEETPVAEAPGGTETVLLAEDEETVRELAKTILERAGYSVLCARDGEEALVLFRESSSRIDVLLFDVVMPNLGGREAYEQIRTLSPGIPVLFTSGYSESALHTNFVLHEGVALVQKPFGRDALLRKLREALDQ